MGQAVDLPDPTEAPTSAAAPSADDLLSQLAGDEIDRLLAESDAESAAQAEAQAAEAQAAAPASPPEAAPADSAAATGAPVSEPAAAPTAEAQSSSLETVLDQAATAPPPPPAAQPAVGEVETAGPSTAPAAPSPAADAATAPSVDAKALDASLAAEATTASPELQATVNEIETSLQERSGLTDSTVGDPALEPVDETPVPIYLKPLVWLNAPVLLLPESLRDAIGKIALLTLFNAIALLGYVMMFRRHHH